MVLEPILSRRIRNRAIDCLEVAASLDAQAAFSPASVINLWEDWRESALGPPPASSLSVDELTALQAFDRAWLAAADGTSDPMPRLAELASDPLWSALTATAEQALSVFSRRGRLPED